MRSFLIISPHTSEVGTTEAERREHIFISRGYNAFFYFFNVFDTISGSDEARHFHLAPYGGDMHYTLQHLYVTAAATRNCHAKSDQA